MNNHDSSEYEEAEIVTETTRPRSRTEQFARNRAADYASGTVDEIKSQIIWTVVGTVVLPMVISLVVVGLIIYGLFWLLPNWIAWVIIFIFLTPIIAVLVSLYRLIKHRH